MKIFASDLDGTLLNENFDTDITIETCIDKVLKSNNEFVVVTGRTLNGVKNLATFYDKDIYIIAMNGALILNKHKEVESIKKIDKDIIIDALKLWNNENVEFITKDSIYMTLSKEKYLEEYSRWDKWQQKLMKEPKKLEEHLSQYIFGCSAQTILAQDILKINVLELDEREYSEKLNIVDRWSEKIDNAPFSKGVLEITSKNISKASALNYLVQLENWEQKDIHVFGDGFNDVEMLSSFENTYAPCDACVEVKNVVNKIVDSYKEHGVIKEINLLLNK